MAEGRSKSFKVCELTGSKVRLRIPDPKDARIAYGLVNDDRITRNILWDGPPSIEDLADGFRRRALWWLNGTGEFSFSLEERDGSTIIGSIYAHAEANPLQVSLGYWLGVPYWGLGYMSEAVRLVTHFAFGYLDAIRTFATVFVGNTASQKVLENNGYTLDGTLRSHVLKRNRWRDERFFTLLRAEWEDHKEWYKPKLERIIPL